MANDKSQMTPADRNMIWSKMVARAIKDPGFAEGLERNLFEELKERGVEDVLDMDPERDLVPSLSAVKEMLAAGRGVNSTSLGGGLAAETSSTWGSAACIGTAGSWCGTAGTVGTGGSLACGSMAVDPGMMQAAARSGVVSSPVGYTPDPTTFTTATQPTVGTIQTIGTIRPCLTTPATEFSQPQMAARAAQIQSQQLSGAMLNRPDVVALGTVGSLGTMACIGCASGCAGTAGTVGTLGSASDAAVAARGATMSGSFANPQMASNASFR